MMEIKLWVGFCALVLLLNVASVTTEGDVNAESTTPKKTSALNSTEALGSVATGSTSNTTLNQSKVISSNLTGCNTTINPGCKNGSTIISFTTQPPATVSVPSTSKTNKTVTMKSPTKDPVTAPGSQKTSSQTPPTSTNITTTHGNATPPPGVSSTTPTSTNSSTTPDSTSSSAHTTHSSSYTSTSTLTPAASKNNTTEITVTIKTPSLTPMPSSSTQTKSHMTEITVTSTTSTPTPTSRSSTQTKSHMTEITVTSTTSTPTPTSSSPTQTKSHVDRPSQLNVGEDTKSPTLNSLVAGLVSAFVITAVIITLLLFLKLRRRDSRPEFRRLQDLPMDDMEDTPLSMYSY